MIKISHEVPLKLLEESRNFNDYDYALVHLFDKYPQYHDFYIQSLEMGRVVYLDNSCFELGEPYDIEKFKFYCDKFSKINYENFYCVAPDIMNNSIKTIESFKNFKISCKKIGVVQGEDLNSRLEVFEFMLKNADIIAIPRFQYLNNNSLDHDGEGLRKDFLKSISKFKITKPIHILGCKYPQNLCNLPDFVYSLDTSNPIVHGLFRKKYTKFGLNIEDRIDIKLADLIDWQDEIPEEVFQNIKIFKELINEK